MEGENFRVAPGAANRYASHVIKNCPKKCQVLIFGAIVADEHMHEPCWDQKQEDRSGQKPRAQAVVQRCFFGDEGVPAARPYPSASR